MSAFIKKIVTILVVLAAAGALAGLFYFYHLEPDVEENRVARISLDGPLQSSAAGFADMVVSPGRVENELNRAEQTEGVEAVVVSLNSPGGTVAASQEIYDLFAEFELPLVVSMGDMAASGGYYISAAADSIIAQPGSMTGSIGVIFSIYDPEGLLDKIGIEREIIKSGEHKDMFNRSLEPGEREMLQEMSDTAHRQFLEAIASGRELDIEEVEELATGEVYLGEQALEKNLVDELGGKYVALEHAGELADIEDPVYYDMPEPPIYRRLLGLTAQIRELIRNFRYSEDMKTIERVEEGLSPVLKYKVPGY